MNIRDRVTCCLTKSQVGKRIVEDQRHRIILFASFVFLINLLFALYNGILGAITGSLWFVAMCVYYIILSIMRFSAVLCERKRTAASSVNTEYFLMKLSGVLLSGLSIVLMCILFIGLSQHIVAKYDTIVMITIATYTFYKITGSVIRAVRQRKNPSPLLAVLRNIGYADVAASVVSLQRSIMDIITGAIACSFIMILGIIMIARGFQKRR